jgi:hypothetical protein
LENVRSLLFLQLENEEEIAHSNCLHSYGSTIGIFIFWCLG